MHDDRTGCQSSEGTGKVPAFHILHAVLSLMPGSSAHTLTETQILVFLSVNGYLFMSSLQPHSTSRSVTSVGKSCGALFGRLVIAQSALFQRAWKGTQSVFDFFQSLCGKQYYDLENEG